MSLIHSITRHIHNFLFVHHPGQCDMQCLGFAHSAATPTVPVTIVALLALLHGQYIISVVNNNGSLSRRSNLWVLCDKTCMCGLHCAKSEFRASKYGTCKLGVANHTADDLVYQKPMMNTPRVFRYLHQRTRSNSQLLCCLPPCVLHYQPPGVPNVVNIVVLKLNTEGAYITVGAFLNRGMCIIVCVCLFFSTASAFLLLLMLYTCCILLFVIVSMTLKHAASTIAISCFFTVFNVLGQSCVMLLSLFGRPRLATMLLRRMILM